MVAPRRRYCVYAPAQNPGEREMGALLLERMTWPEVRAEVQGGRDTVVVPLGAVEQHGPHLPLGTDAMFGDEIGRAAAERLNAFLAPTIRVGCSHPHLAFAGTISR